MNTTYISTNDIANGESISESVTSSSSITKTTVATTVGGIVMLVSGSGGGEESPPDSISSSSADEGVAEHLLLSSARSGDADAAKQRSFVDLLDIDALLPCDLSSGEAVASGISPSTASTSLPPISSFTKVRLDLRLVCCRLLRKFVFLHL